MEPTGKTAERTHQPVCLEHRKRVATIKAFSLGAEAALSLRDPSERASERAHKVNKIRVVYELVKLHAGISHLQLHEPLEGHAAAAG
jgi:hypothetical protein